MRNCLVSASWCSWCFTCLWVSKTFFNFCFFNLHWCETDIRSDWILVPWFTWEDTGSIWTVWLKSFERIEVHDGSRGVWVPLCVDCFLCIVVPQFFVVFSVVESVKAGTSQTKFRSWSEGRDRCYCCDKSGYFKILCIEKAMLNGFVMLWIKKSLYSSNARKLTMIDWFLSTWSC